MEIARRFRGPPDSGNGGYVCGVVASLLDGPAEVMLRSPPPLELPYDVERDDRGVRVLARGQLVAEGRPAEVDVEAPPPPSFDEATRSIRPWVGHPFPMCFVCGPDREAGDGLRIFPGPVASRPLAAAPFTVDATVVGDDGRLRPEITWAVLDCPSWFGYGAFHETPPGGVMLGRLAARIDERPREGERCVCVGWSFGREGRKIRCASALYGEAGDVLAVAEALWITLR